MLTAIYQNIKFLVGFGLLFFVIISCETTKDNNLNTLDSFLDQNHIFNTKRLNSEKARHFRISKVYRELRSENATIFDTRYKKLIANIDQAIRSEAATITLFTEEYNAFLADIKNVLAKFYRKRLDTFVLNTKFLEFNNQYLLKTMKNNLTLMMVYAYESFSGNIMNGYTDTGAYVRIKTTSEQLADTTKIILVSRYLQDSTQQKEIVVDKIVCNGFEKNINYKIEPYYAFTNIVLDSLRAGNYTIEGTVHYYNRNGATVIPFQEDFKLD